MSHVWQEPQPKAETPVTMSENVVERPLRTSRDWARVAPWAVLGLALAGAAAAVIALLVSSHGTQNSLPANNGRPGIVTQIETAQTPCGREPPAFNHLPPQG